MSRPSSRWARNGRRRRNAGRRRPPKRKSGRPRRVRGCRAPRPGTSRCRAGRASNSSIRAHRHATVVESPAPATVTTAPVTTYVAPATTSGPVLPEGFGTGDVHVATGTAGFPVGLEDCHVGAVTGRAYVGIDCGGRKWKLVRRACTVVRRVPICPRRELPIRPGERFCRSR